MEDPAAQKLTLENGDIDYAFDLTSDQIAALDPSKAAEQLSRVGVADVGDQRIDAVHQRASAGRRVDTVPRHRPVAELACRDLAVG